MKFTIIDYGIGNLLSIIKSFEKNGIDLHLSRDSKTIKNSSGLILPGVGAFGTAVKTLHDLNLFDEIKSFVKTGKPVLGICLGMQLFAESGSEDGITDGLGFIGGSVIIEVIFGIPGMGSSIFESITLRDYNAVMAVLLISSTLTLIGMLLSDLSYALVDPRITFE